MVNAAHKQRKSALQLNYDKKYTTIADLLADDSFVAWYLKKNEKDGCAWNQWIAAAPEQAALAKQAERMLSVLIDLETKNVSAYQRNISFGKLLKKIIEQEKKMRDLIQNN